MVFKINVSKKGKTYKFETDNEFLVGKNIGESFEGGQLVPELAGFELEITGTSDASGFPGFKHLEGSGYHRKLLTHGQGMKDTRNGIRLRKTQRGKEISLKTSQVNMIVLKEHSKKFEDLFQEKTE
jgi:ribosomal protein S6E (S10)